MNTKIIKLDADDLVMAMGDQSTVWMLDPVTGKQCMDREEAELMWGSEATEAFAPTDPEQVLPLPNFSSSDAYRLMQRFAQEHACPDASGPLLEALGMRKPFRRFKDALMDFPDDERRWFDFETEAIKQIAEDFYAEEGYSVQWIQSGSESTGKLP